MSSVTRNIRFVAAALSLIAATTGATAEWKGPFNKHSFPHNFPAGWEADGRQFFVTQCARRDWEFSIRAVINENGTVSPRPGTPRISDKKWHIGKAGTHLREGATYSYGGKEVDCKKHVVFAPENPSDFHWVEASNGEVPAGAVRGFNDNERQVVCRIPWEGGLHPGKLIPSSKACFIGYGDHERALSGYEVLVRK
ncbi:MAG: hypothetical protein C0606_02070 [Hyphomicrobiales bacterium]|nr:MAG: hypothetical protein C0606_02070 [Hyphomicrobiales bacterium]